MPGRRGSFRRTVCGSAAERAALFALSVSIVLLVFDGESAAADSPAEPARVSADVAPVQTDGPTLRTGFRVSGGVAGSPTPSDAADADTLLYGTSFSGPSFRLASSTHLDVLRWLRVRSEIGLGWSSISGFARDGERSREIRFQLTTADILVGTEAWAPLGDGPFRFFAGFALGPRFGVHARATDERVALDTDEDLLRLRLGTSFVGMIEAGFAWQNARFRVPFGVRLVHNFTYPQSTSGRLDGPMDDDRTPRYLVESTWHLMGTVGMDFQLGRRR